MDMLFICEELQLDCLALGLAKSQDTTLIALILVGLLPRQEWIAELMPFCDTL